MQLSNQSIPNSTIQILFNALNELLDNLFQALLDNSPDQGSKYYISKAFSTFKNNIQIYSSIYRRSKLLNNSVFVRPREIVIAMRPESVRSQKLETYVERNIPCSYQYIPILETLKLLLSKNKDYYSSLFSKNNDINDKEIVYGSCLTSNKLFQTKKYFLQLQIFYDDFETTNPLGSKTGSHKLGSIYFSVKKHTKFS